MTHTQWFLLALLLLAWMPILLYLTVELVRQRLDAWWTYVVLWHAKRYQEKLLMWIASKCPHALARWIFVRVAVYNEPGNPGERLCIDAMKAWD
jgi:hypothetical protein